MTNKKNKIFIIGIPRKISGIGHILKSTLSHIIDAKNKGLLPIVDLKHYTNQYFKEGRVYKDNTWEYFFEQPNNISLENIPDGRVIEIINTVENYPEASKLSNIDNLLHWNKYVKRNDLNKISELYELKKMFNDECKFNKEMLKFFNEKLNSYNIKSQDKILGCLCRGTDYLYKKPDGELIQPSPKDVIKKVKKYIVKHKYNKIYLATEDIAIYKMFKKEFGDLLLPNDQYMYGDDYDNKSYLCDFKVYRKDHFYNLGKEYLFSLFMLSKCNAFIGGYTNGTVVSWFLSNNWEYVYIYDLGIYKSGSFIQKIFSIKNQYRTNGKKYKIITILGIKMKFRMK